jgi:uncharacterized protein YbaP (TraB family)
MKFPLAITAAVLLISTLGQAQAAAPATDAAPIAVVTPPLYKIEKNGQAAYILGTLDGGADVNELSQVIKKAVISSQTLVVERVESREEDEATFANLVKESDEPVMRAQFSDEDWYNLVYRMSPADDIETGAVIDAILPYAHPVTAVQTYLAYQATVKIYKAPVKEAIPTLFTKPGQEIVGVETADTYYKMLVATETVPELKRLLALPADQIQKTTDAMVAAYRSGDAETLAKLVVSKYSEANYKIAITERSAAWAQAVGELFQREGQEFILVDVANVVGENGLAADLAKLGFTVTLVDQAQPAPARVLQPVPAVDVTSTIEGGARAIVQGAVKN